MSQVWQIHKTCAISAASLGYATNRRKNASTSRRTSAPRAASRTIGHHPLADHAVQFWEVVEQRQRRTIAAGPGYLVASWRPHRSEVGGASKPVGARRF